MYFNHATAGALVIKPIIDRIEHKLTPKELTALWFIGITSSVLPDFDIAYSVLKNLEDHRSFVTHGLFLYLIFFLLIYILSYFQKKEEFGKKFFQTSAYVFLLGVLTHFFIDFLIGGIAVFSPFSYKIYGLDMNIKNGYSNRLFEYLISRYMIIEVSITSLFFIIFKGKKYFVPKVFALSYFLIAVISFILVSLSFF
ncbi:metal-dependent hydrolase [Patescibacteria group bacterium]|nr:metal-dependent hydrolase [Patescibacteria group bacterium]